MWSSGNPKLHPPHCDGCECTAQICIRTQTLTPHFGEGCLQMVLALTCWESSRQARCPDQGHGSFWEQPLSLAEQHGPFP